MEVTPYINIYSTMFKHRHSQIVGDDGIQRCVQENAAYDDK